MERFEIERYRRQIEAIKLSVIGLPETTGLTVSQVLVDDIQLLYSRYLASGKNELLIQAIVHIQAYLEMGFVYDQEEQLFDLILHRLGTEKRLVFPKRYYAAKKVKLNRNSVRRIIKKWPKTKSRPFTIDELISDIIDKVTNRKFGIYYYESIQGENNIVGMYELVIDNNESYFHDMICRKYYIFDEE